MCNTQILTKSLYPYIKKLSLKEIASIKDGLQQKQHSSLQQVGLVDLACVSSDYFDHQTKVDDWRHEETVKKRPSLSLKRRKKEQHSTANVQKRESPLKRKYSSLKKLNLSSSRSQQELIMSSQYSEDHDTDMDSVTLKVNQSSASRYHPLQFVTAKQEHCTNNDFLHHHGNDSSDALLNMGYLSPMFRTYVDSDCNPDESLSLSPFRCQSPVSSSHSPLSFTLMLAGSSRSSSPQPSTSSCAGGTPSPPPISPTSFGNKLDINIVFCGQHVQYDQVATSSAGSCDQVADTPLDGSDNDAISYISESPKSKLSFSDIPMDINDKTCIITPTLAPPTLSHLLNTMDQYNLPHVVYEQPFCSKPEDVPPIK